MRSRLESYVGQMRAQTMTFNTDGVEMRLSVPDNASVKDTLQMFIGTIVQQQDHIVNLQSTITQLSNESLAAQKRIVAWTVELVTETHTSLQEKINESNVRTQNVAHNIQGFSDRNEGSRYDLGTAAATKLTPPAFQAIKVEDVDGSEYLSPFNASAAIAGSHFAGSRSMSMKGSIKPNASEKVKTMRMPRPESKEYYDMIRKNDMPKTCAARWRWAVRKVMRNTRIGKNEIELSRLRVVKSASVVDRLVRLESEMFQIPLDMQNIRQKVEETSQRAQKDTDSLRAELEKLKLQLAAQQEKTRNSAFSLSNKIDEVKASCAQLDRTCSDMDRALSKSTGHRNKQKGSLKQSDKSPIEVKKSDLMMSDKEKEKEKERDNEEVVNTKKPSIQFDTDTTKVSDNVPTDQADSSKSKSEKTEVPKLKREHSSKIEKEKEKEKSGGSRKDNQASDSNKSKRKGSEKVEKIDVGNAVADGDAVKGAVLLHENQSTAVQSEVSPQVDNSALLNIDTEDIDKDDDVHIQRSASAEGEGFDGDLGLSADNDDVDNENDNEGYSPSREIDSDHSERVGLELDSLNRRLNCTESTHGKILQGKVHDLQAEVGILQDNATMTLKQMIKLKARLNMTPSSSNEISSVGDSVSSLTQLDRDIKDMHRAVWVLESRVTALRDVERGVRGEISHTTAALKKIRGDSSPRAFSSEEEKDELLMLCEEVKERIEGISLSLLDSGTDSLAFSSLFGEQWNTLISLLKPTHSTQRHQDVSSLPSNTRLPSPSNASSSITAFASVGSTDTSSNSPALDKLKREVEAMKLSKATLEDVRVISRETVTGALAHALGPIRTKMEHLEGEIARLKESVSNVSEAATADREWLQTNAEEMSRRDEEMQLKEAERNFREEEQRRRDEEQRKRDIEQRSMENRRHDEDEQRRRDDDQRRREEEEQRSGEEIQRDHEANGGLPLGIIACLRHDIESAVSDCLEEGEEEDVEVEDDALPRNQGSKIPGLIKLKVTNDRIEEGSAVIVIAGDNRGKQGMVVNIRTLPHDDDEDYPSIECVQYLIRLEPNLRSTANSPSKQRNSRPTSAMPRKKERDRDRDNGDEKVLPKNNVEIMKLRDEIQQMEITLKMLGRDKINGHQAQQMIELRTAQVAAGDDKVDNEAFAVVEVAVKNLAIDLDDLRHHQSRRLATVKKQFEESFQAMTVNQSTTAETDTGMFSSVITTGQCLGCGRLSAINHVPPAPSSPETFRAGFKMPLAFTPMGPYPFRAVSPLPLGGSETETARPVSAALVAKNADIAGNQHTTSECMDLSLDSIAPQYRTIRPRTSSGVYSASQRTSSRGAAAAGLSPVTTGVTAQAISHPHNHPHSQSLSQSQSHSLAKLLRDEAQGHGVGQGQGGGQGGGMRSAARMLQRSGFAGRKSARAEHAYAPERFEAAPDFSLPHYTKVAGSSSNSTAISLRSGAGPGSGARK